MAHQDCPGVAQIDFIYQYDGQKIQNAFHVLKFGLAPYTMPELEALRGIAQAYWLANQRPLLCGDIALNQIVVTDLTSLNGFRITETFSPPSAGLAAGLSDSANATMAIKLALHVRGRGKSGRIFWPALPGAEVTNNTIGDGYSGDAVAAVDFLRTEIDTATTGLQNLCVLSRVAAGVPRVTGIGLPVLNVGVADAFVDSMKNRLPNHKRHKRTP